MIAEFEDSGKVVAQYIHGSGLGADVGSLLMKEEVIDDAVQTSYYYSNHRGDVINTADDTGALIASYRYDAFGNVIETSGTAESDIQFSSKRFDDSTNLSYFGARYYDSLTGRFISRDPMEYVDGPNMYIYVSNNPLTFFDPFGLDGQLTIISESGDNKLFDRVNSSAINFSPEFGNHALIVYQSDDYRSERNFTYEHSSEYYGTWGREDIGVVGLKINYPGDIHYEDSITADKRTTHINKKQEKVFFKRVKVFMDKGKDSWTECKPCSYSASDIWNKTTNEKVQDRHWKGIGYSDPNALSKSIRKYNETDAVEDFNNTSKNKRGLCE